MEKHFNLKTIISRNTNQAHPVETPEERGVASGNQGTADLPFATAMSTTTHPVGCETLIEGVSPIVAE